LMKKVLERSLRSPDAVLSMIIGFAVVLAIGFAIINSVKTANVRKQEELKKQEELEGQIPLPAEHITKEGENLWVISEVYYKTGYNWVDISEENKLVNPDLIYPDQKLTIPDVKPRFPEGDITPEAASTTGPKHKTYTIVEGDTLWDISMKEYETNYRWPDISQTNKLPNPDLIYPDVILQMPQ
ncbi:MAG: Peptidoglycan-binding lysin domain protein, partial [Microgenomates group bacterium GW2011_GWC1_43_11]